MDIYRYVLVDRKGVEDDDELDDYQEAVDKAQGFGTSHAVVERTYTYSDSELIWTPDGSKVWPPKPRRRQHKEVRK